jgi:chloramphenicol-sensitive protein RarD
LPLATLGMLQYIGPTLQLILAVWVFHEPFSTQRLIGFAFIWTALLVMSADGLGLTRWMSSKPEAAPAP